MHVSNIDFLHSRGFVHQALCIERVRHDDEYLSIRSDFVEHGVDLIHRHIACLHSGRSGHVHKLLAEVVCSGFVIGDDEGIGLEFLGPLCGDLAVNQAVVDPCQQNLRCCHLIVLLA